MIGSIFCYRFGFFFQDGVNFFYYLLGKLEAYIVIVFCIFPLKFTLLFQVTPHVCLDLIKNNAVTIRKKIFLTVHAFLLFSQEPVFFIGKTVSFSLGPCDFFTKCFNVFSRSIGQLFVELDQATIQIPDAIVVLVYRDNLDIQAGAEQEIFLFLRLQACSQNRRDLIINSLGGL